jgi:hypothetical protein
VFRHKYTAVIATAAIAMALGGAGVALAASGGDGSKSSGAGPRATTSEQSDKSHCDHDRNSSDT